MKRALLLNADYAPLHFIPDVEAFIMVYKGIADVVDTGGKPSYWENETFTSPGRTWEVPATIRLVERIHKRWKPPRFRKKVLFNRDAWKCQYCSMELNWSSVTIDHVQPKSRGGGTSWRNCVASCKSCNKRKANKTPDEASMPLLRHPIEPTPLHFWDVTKSASWHSDWDMFLPRG